MFILERSREKGKQFSILSKQPILHPRNFQKYFEKRKTYTHTHTNILLTETRLLSIKTTGKVLPPEEEERSGKGSGRKIKWCNGKKVRQRERREREHGGGLSRRYVRARAARGEEGGGWTNGAWSARDDTRTLLLRSVGFGRNSRALGAHVWPAADLSPSCR